MKSEADKLFAQAAEWSTSEKEKDALWRRAAEMGHAGAMYELGHAYCTILRFPGWSADYNREKNEKTGAEWYAKAAELGHVESQIALSECYKEGKGVSKDAEKSQHWLEQAAKQGHIKSQIEISSSYRIGYGVPKDAEKSKYWFEQAIEQATARKNAEMLYLLSQELHSDVILNKIDAHEGSAKVIELCTRAAELGNAIAQFQLGQYYEKGTDLSIVEQDFAKAVYWYEKAIKKRYSEALCCLGFMYMDGRGVEKDEKKGYDMVEEAASGGCRRAMDYIAEYNSDGSETIPDPFDVLNGKYGGDDWHRERAEKGARLGDAYWQRVLAEYYLHGERGVPKDLAKAKEWYAKSAAQGDERAADELKKLQ